MAMFTRPLGPTLASETTQAIAAANTLESAVLAASDDQTLAAQLLPAWAPSNYPTSSAASEHVATFLRPPRHSSCDPHPVTPPPSPSGPL